MTRREFLRTSVATMALLPAACRAPRVAPGKGQPVTVADAFDVEMERFMAARRVPGGALAVVKDRRLVYARGYGWADRDQRIPVTAQSLFRIASISKPITAVAVLKLVEDGKLDLEAKAFASFDLPPMVPGASRDPRLAQITIRQLLQHTGGWDREKSFDPMFRPTLIAETVGGRAPAGARDVIRYMLGQPLDFDPGTRYGYSNFGYCVLGRIIEQVTQKSYDAYVQERILNPSGIRTMRLGASLESGRAPREVRYYMRGRSLTTAVFPEVKTPVSWPYGAFHLEAMDAHGGWIASPIDLLRFVIALEDPAGTLLRRTSIETMLAAPAPPAWRGEDGKMSPSHYGCGWMVRPDPANPIHGQPNYWHSGSLPGTATLLVRRRDGLSWAVLFNQRSHSARRPDTDIDPAMHRAAAAVTAWPGGDLFSAVE
jgi:N-acyl-D-amino-acid deacylase